MIEKNFLDKKCEVCKCENHANFFIWTGGKIFKNRFYICEECLKQLNLEAKKLFTPKAVENPFKIIKMKEKN